MKKVLSVLAVAVFSIGLFSCEPETSVAETDALYDTIDIDATVTMMKSPWFRKWRKAR